MAGLSHTHRHHMQESHCILYSTCGYCILWSQPPFISKSMAYGLLPHKRRAEQHDIDTEEDLQVGYAQDELPAARRDKLLRQLEEQQRANTANDKVRL